MTKKEKEILHGIIDRSGEKKANPMIIAEAVVLLFPDDPEEVIAMFDNDCDCDKKQKK